MYILNYLQIKRVLLPFLKILFSFLEIAGLYPNGTTDHTLQHSTYQLIKIGLTFMDAVNNCATLGGVLAMPTVTTG